METELKLHSLLKLINIEEYPKERAQALWEKVREQEYAFDDTTRNDWQLFLAQLLMPNNLFLEIGELKGLVCVLGLQPRIGGIVHFLLWDKVSLRELRDAGNSLLDNLFQSYELHRMSAFIPEGNTSAIHLSAILGFEKEGCMKEAFLNQAEYQDVYMFGLLRERFNSLKEF